MKRKAILGLLIFALVSILLFCSYILIITNYKLPTDSGYHYTITKQIIINQKFMFWDNWAYAGSINPYTPNFHVLSATFSNITGLSLIQVFHILIILAFILLPIFVFLLMKEFYNYKIAILSSILIGLSSLWIKFSYGKYPQMYATLIMFLLILYFFKLLKKENLKNIILFIIFFSSVILYHHLTGFLVGVVFFFIFLFSILFKKLKFKTILYLSFFCFILILPWLAHSISYHITTLQSQTLETGLTIYRFQNNIDNFLNVESDIHLSIIAFIFSIWSGLFLITQDYKKNSSAILFFFSIIPLLIGLSIFLGIYFQNYRFLIFGILFLIGLSSIGLHYIIKNSSKSYSFILIFLVIIFIFVPFAERIDYLSTKSYTNPLDEYSFIREIEDVSNIIPENNSIIISDGYTKLAWWIPGALEKKTILVGRKNSYKGTPIYDKILDGENILKSKDLDSLEEIIKSYPEDLYVIIPNIWRISFNFDWAFKPNYTKFYQDGEKIKSEIIYEGNIIDIAKLSIKK